TSGRGNSRPSAALQYPGPVRVIPVPPGGIACIFPPATFRPMKLTPFLLPAFLTLLTNASALDLQKGDRVCVVGNTFGERMQFSGYFETLLHARHPDKEIVVRNLSWSADTLMLRPRPLDCPTQDQFLTTYR